MTSANCLRGRGEAGIDAAEMQAVRIDTHQAFQAPLGIKVFLANIQQTGFSVTYRTEFRFNVLWG